MSDAPAAQGAPKTQGAQGGRGWWRLLRNLYREMNQDHVGLIAAGVAFYGLLAIFPGIVAAMAIAGLVIEPQTIVTQLEGFRGALPQEAAAIIIDQAIAVAGSEEGGLGLAAILGVLIALYSASKGVQSLIEGLNVAFEVEETRGFVRLYLVIFGMTIAMILGFLLIVAIGALLPLVLTLLPGIGNFTETIVAVVRWPIVLAILAAGLAILYRYAPDRPAAPWRWVTPGAGAACALWLVGSLAFAAYVSNFGSYNETFGALGGVIVLLTWLWLTSFIVLMGAELDSELERQEKVAGGPTAEAARSEPQAKPASEKSVAEMVSSARPQP